jgi:hypothetical protein
MRWMKAMNRAVVLILTIVLALGLLTVSARAENFPSFEKEFTQPLTPPPAKVMPQRFYGYVPPPPIRDTWPGGYRVIFHELRETLLNHIQGYY